jgi:ATP phosphoribosyltransferase regulatory subunit
VDSFPAARAAVGELRAVIDLVAEAGLADRLALDVGELRGLDYYTGLVFRIYARGLGFEVGGGGRYDALLARFGRPMPAVGFMIGLDRVAALLDRRGRDVAAATAPARARGSLRAAREARASGARVRLEGTR